MKICIVNFYYESGGAGAIAKSIARGFAKGHEVFFLACSDRDAEFEEEGYRVILFKNEKSNPLKTYINMDIFLKLRKKLMEIKPDILHFHNVQDKSFSLISLLLSRQYKTFWTLHDLWSVCAWSYPRPYNCNGMTKFCIFCKKAPGLSVLSKVSKMIVFSCSKMRVIVPSAWLGKMVEKHTNLPKKSITHVPYGVDLELFKPIPDSRRSIDLNLQEEDKIVMFVGYNYEERKGMRFLISALPTLRKKIKGFKLLVLGERPTDIKLEEDIVFTGRVMYEEMAKYYSASNVVVIPTLSDNLPMTILESMACGTPVVGTNVGGIPEMIVDGVNGFLIEPENTEMMIDRINKILMDRRRGRSMGAMGRTYVQEKFALKDMLDKTMEIYRECADRC
jgi:glycosyltransferase involved in cell wall biosynthesis